MKKLNSRVHTKVGGNGATEPRRWYVPENPGEDFLTGAEWVLMAGTARLTTRELVVAALLLKGQTRKSIASRLKLSPQTVRVHIDRLFEKFKVRDRLGLGLRIARIREAIRLADGDQRKQAGITLDHTKM